ncbi:MAG: S41 family peptidase [Bacteroides cellulosilyticus]|nr:S41 family peptidase [Bacteroides cellulosilyticus]
MKRLLLIASLLIFFIFDGMGIVSATCIQDSKRQIDSLLQIRKSRERIIKGKLNAVDIITPLEEVSQLLYVPKEHPNNTTVPDSVVNRVIERAYRLSKDSLSSTDLIGVLKPYLSWMQYLDPHLRVEPQPIMFENLKKANNIPIPGFLSLNINDTLIVARSLDPNFQKGDQILAINDIAVDDYLAYCYADRYIYPFTLLANYHYTIFTSPQFDIQLKRNGKKLNIKTVGKSWSTVYQGLIHQREFQSQSFMDSQVGYFSIPEFYPNNTLLIKKLRQAILKAKNKGCKSFILDLRGNPGGNGHAFDQLLSIFINKPSISYLKQQLLRVSKWIQNDYDFLTDDLLNQLIVIPDEHTNKEVLLNQRLYIDGIKYYLLMDKDTGSIAASFCNILQYNDAAILVGEPLLHNALKYGETIDARFGITGLNIAISTLEIDEYTKAVDGVLMPDIPISYVARDYLSGRDAMLDKLLEIIKSDQIN